MRQIEHLLATTVAARLQLPLTRSATPTDQLIQALYEKDLLLLLDNCEYLPVAAFIDPLLQPTRHLKLLVTSLTRLNVRGEQLLALSGLATPEQPLTHQITVTTATHLNEYGAISCDAATSGAGASGQQPTAKKAGRTITHGWRGE